MTEKRVTRRGFLQGLAVAAGSGVLAACAPQVVKETVIVEKSVDKIVTATPAPKEQVTVRVNHWSGDSPMYTAVFDAFTQKTGGMIKIEQDSVGWTEHMQQILTWIAAGTTPDALLITSWRMDGLFKNGYLEDLNPYIANDVTTDPSEFPEWFWNYAGYEGGLYGIPLNAATDVWFYNITAFEDAGIDTPADDWNWDDFAAIAKALTRKSGDEYEFFGCSVVANSFPLQFMAMYQNGGALMNEEGTKITITKPESIEAVQWWADLFLHGEVSVTSGVAADATDQDLFVANRVGMIHRSSGFMDTLTTSLADGPFEWGILLEPKRVTQDQWGATNYASVFADSKVKEEAYQVMSFWASPEAHIIMAKRGGIHAPVRYGAYRDYMSSLTFPPGVQLHANQWDMVVKIPWRAPFEEQLFKIYVPSVNDVWNGSRTAKEVFEEIEPQMNALFEA